VLLGLSLSALAVFAVLAHLARRGRIGRREEQKPVKQSTGLSLPIFLLFSVLLFLYVGGETCVSGWIATYVHRFAGFTPERSSLFVSLFWLSIVAGRALIPLLVRVISDFAVLVAGVILASIGMLILAVPGSTKMSLVAVVLAGVGCAPVFPLAVARLLSRIGYSRHSGWIFAICGSGGAVLPWAMGLYSAHSGSLRTAFAVPLAAMAGVFLLILIERALPTTRQGHAIYP